MSHVEDKIKTVEKFKQELTQLQVNLLEYEFYVSALGNRVPRALSRELLRRHIVVARKMDAYARQNGEPANYEASLLANLQVAQNE